jgi:hypothetical protein
MTLNKELSSGVYKTFKSFRVYFSVGDAVLGIRNRKTNYHIKISEVTNGSPLGVYRAFLQKRNTPNLQRHRREKKSTKKMRLTRPYN